MPKPDVHLCSTTCRVKCALGSHLRPHAAAKCLCCHRVPVQRERVLATTPRSTRLTTGWWKQRTA